MENALVCVTGARGTGKSTFLATYLPPNELERCYYVDTEYSANNVVAQLRDSGLAFGRYVNVQDRFRDLPGEDDLLSRIAAGRLPWVTEAQKNALAEFYAWLVADLDKHLTAGTYRQVAIDTVERVEAGMAAWVERNKRASGWSTKAYGRFWNEGVYPLYENLLAAMFQRGVEVVTVASHLRTPWEGDRPVVGKVAPSGKRILYQLSQLFLWMVNEPSDPDGAPAALVLKERMGRLEPDGDGWKIRRTLPRRLPIATWKAISDYQKHPANLDGPRPGEVPTEEEATMMSELLSDAQMRLMILDAEKDLQEARASGAVEPGDTTVRWQNGKASRCRLRSSGCGRRARGFSSNALGCPERRLTRILYMDISVSWLRRSPGNLAGGKK
jgi:hypothetical protein